MFGVNVMFELVVE